MQPTVLAGSALLLLTAGSLGWGGRPAAGASPAPPVISAAGARYDRSRAGQRLGRRLRRAGIQLVPSQWRLAQLAVLPPTVLVLVLVGVRGYPALLWGLSGVRLGGAGLLWTRRDRQSRRRAAAAPLLARVLAAELGTGVTGGRAIENAAAAAALGRSDPVLRDLLTAAALRVAVGYDGGTALERALAVRRDSLGRVERADPLSAVAAGFAVQARLGAAGAVALQRLADALEEALSTRRAAAAATAEARLAALSVPLVAVIAGALLVTAEPRSLLAASTLPGCAALLACTLCAIVGVILVARLTSV